jgi:hypothetical protein
MRDRSLYLTPASACVEIEDGAVGRDAGRHRPMLFHKRRRFRLIVGISMIASCPHACIGPLGSGRHFRRGDLK